jgi:hypothetical protein
VTTEREAMIELATKLGFELGKAEGRKQAGEEIAQAITEAGDKRSQHRHHDRPTVSRLGSVRHASYLDAAEIARDLTSQPSGAVSTPRTDPDGHSDLPKDPRGLSNRNPADLTKGGQ